MCGQCSKRIIMSRVDRIDALCADDLSKPRLPPFIVNRGHVCVVAEYEWSMPTTTSGRRKHRHLLRPPKGALNLERDFRTAREDEHAPPYGGTLGRQWPHAADVIVAGFRPTTV